MHKSATLQNFATFARRCSTPVHNSKLWHLDNAAVRNFATMRIYSILRTEFEREGFVCCHAVLLLLLKQSPKYWFFQDGLELQSEQTSDMIRQDSKRCNSCVKSKNIGESFMMLLLKMDLSALGFYVRWLWFKINTDFPKQTDALINQEILMCSSCLNLKQISVVFVMLWLKIDLSEL